MDEGSRADVLARIEEITQLLDFFVLSDLDQRDLLKAEKLRLQARLEEDLE